jgi:glyoxylase I family protein
MAISTTELPLRLHHNAYVTTDQEATRHFYEDIIGMPLMATWAEHAELFGKTRVYCHTFYGMADGGALAFFQFAEEEDQEFFGPKMPGSAFHHIAMKCDRATQDGIKARLEKSNYDPGKRYHIDHGYCDSIYIEDPNGLLLEFTIDAKNVEAINEARLGDAHQTLKRWLGGDHSPNNLDHHD